MSDRRRRRFAVCLSALVVSTALLLAVGTVSAQPGGAPPPPPGGEQPGGAPPPPPGTAAPPPGTAAPPPGAAPAPPPRPRVFRYARELRLNIAIGVAVFVFDDELVGQGPALRLAAHWVRWWGPFMIGGGPSVYYMYMTEEKEPKDWIHMLTVNGEFMIGGGIYRRFAIYLHAVLGAGFAKAYDAETRDHLMVFGARAVGGLGAYVHVARFLSVGAVVDVGWPGTVDAMVTLGFHFGRRW